jgi:hypothetical protein
MEDGGSGTFINLKKTTSHHHRMAQVGEVPSMVLAFCKDFVEVSREKMDHHQNQEETVSHLTRRETAECTGVINCIGRGLRTH